MGFLSPSCEFIVRRNDFANMLRQHDRRMKRLLLLNLALLAACADPGGIVHRSVMVDPASLEAQRSLPDEATAAAWPELDWWRRFRDSQLDALVEEGLAGSPSIRLARPRVDQALATPPPAPAAGAGPPRGGPAAARRGRRGDAPAFLRERHLSAADRRLDVYDDAGRAERALRARSLGKASFGVRGGARPLARGRGRRLHRAARALRRARRCVRAT